MDESYNSCSRILIKRAWDLILSPIKKFNSDYTQLFSLMFSSYWYHAIPCIILLISVSLAVKIHLKSAKFSKNDYNSALLRGLFKLIIHFCVLSCSIFTWLLFSELIYCNCLTMCGEAKKMEQTAWFEEIFSSNRRASPRYIVYLVPLAMTTYLSLCLSFLIMKQYYSELKLTEVIPIGLFTRRKHNIKNKDYIIEDEVETQDLDTLDSEEDEEIHFELHPKKNRLVKKRWKVVSLNKSRKMKKL